MLFARIESREEIEMKKIIVALLTSIMTFSLCIPAFAASDLEEKQKEVTQFVDSINQQYDTHFSLTITSDELSSEEIQNLKDSIAEMAKEQKELKDQLREMDMTSPKFRSLPQTKASPITKWVTTNTNSKIADSDGNFLTLTFQISAKVTYYGTSFTNVTAIDSEAVTPKLDWKQKSGTGLIMEDDEGVNISATGDVHYRNNGFKLDSYEHIISAPIWIYDIM